MRRKILPFLAVLLPFFGFCTKSPENGGQSEEEKYANSYYFKASFDPVEGTGISSLWTDDDLLLPYDCSDGTPVGKTEIESGQGKSSVIARILTNLPDGSRVRLMSTPGQNLLHNLDLPTIQHQDPSSQKPWWTHCFAFSDELLLSNSGMAVSDIHFPMTLLRVVLEVDKNSTLLSGQLEKVTLSCSGEPLGGTFSIDWESGKVIPAKWVDSVSAAPSQTMRIQEGDNVLWLCALPRNLEGKQCTLTFELRDASGVKSSQKSSFDGRNLAAGTVHTLRALAEDQLVSKGDPSMAEYSYTPIPVKSTMASASYSTSSSSKTVTLDGMNRMDKYNASTLDPWGGYAGVKPDEITSSNSAGFWRTGKYKGHNVMVNPDGNVTILHGINGLNPDMLRAQSQPESLSEYNARFNSVAEWAQWANAFLRDFGFNFFETGPQRIRNLRGTITPDIESVLQGDGSSTPMSQVAFICFLRTFSWDYYSITGKGGPATTGKDVSVFTLMFDPDWLSYIDALAKDATDIYKGNRNFIGYYTDNELQFRFADGVSGIFLKHWLKLDDKVRCYPYARQYAENFIRNNYGVEPVEENITTEMENAFLLDVARYYYRTVTEAVRRYDKDHLLLGSRLHGAPMWRGEVTKACAEYNDIISTNIYGAWEPQDKYYINHIQALVGDKPCMITEFYTRNGNQSFNGTPYANSGEGGGWIVQNQEARGLYYQNFTRKALTYSNIVGWQWFQAMDDFLIGYGWNNKGLAAPDFHYYECIDHFRRLHWNIYQILDYYCGVSNPSAPEFSNIIWE